MLKTVKVVYLAPGESLLILTDHRPTLCRRLTLRLPRPCPLLVDPQDDDKIVALFS